MKTEGLKLVALRRIAGEKMTDTPALNNAILLAKALLQRPRLIDAILDEEGLITRQSLSKAVQGVFGNSDPNAFSSDPFHAKTNVELVQAFRAAFDELRDRSRDRTGFFESVGIPTRLSAYQLGGEAVDAVVKALTEHGMVKLGERRSITPDVSRAILEAAL